MRPVPTQESWRNNNTVKQKQNKSMPLAKWAYEQIIHINYIIIEIQMCSLFLSARPVEVPHTLVPSTSGLLLFQGWQHVKMTDRCSGMNQLWGGWDEPCTLLTLSKKLCAAYLNDRQYLMLADSSYNANMVNVNKSWPSYNCKQSSPSIFIFPVLIISYMIQVFCCWMFNVLFYWRGDVLQ